VVNFKMLVSSIGNCGLFSRTYVKVTPTCGSGVAPGLDTGAASAIAVKPRTDLKCILTFVSQRVTGVSEGVERM
jgi:hypothetical protein